ncbi:hypothetical protein K8R43_02285 [archaeon]|nr:hypothetical protein [archaeon]
MALKPKKLKYELIKPKSGPPHARFEKSTKKYLQFIIEKQLHESHKKGDFSLKSKALDMHYDEPFHTIHNNIIKEHFSNKKEDYFALMHSLGFITRGHLEHIKKSLKAKEERKARTQIRRQEKKEIENLDPHGEQELLKQLKKKR